MNIPFGGLHRYQFKKGDGILSRIRTATELLKVRRPGIRGVAEDKNPSIEVIRERLQGVVPQIGIHGGGIEAIYLKQGLGILAGGVPDVTPLGIGDDRDVARNKREGLFQSDEAINAQDLIEGEIWLVGTH